MFTSIVNWLHAKWRLIINQDDAVRAYHQTFTSPAGQMVLQHLLDSIYCTVCESNDPIALAAHNAQRAVVHSILENIDYAENPGKYRAKQIHDVITTQANGAHQDA